MSGEEERMSREREHREPERQEAPEKRRAYPGRRPPAPRPGGQKTAELWRWWEQRLRAREDQGEAPEELRRLLRDRLRPRRDSMTALTALSREARRRKVSYGTLCQMLTKEEREEVVRAWRAEHPAPIREEGRCAGCAYWREASATAPELGRMCHFALDQGRSRRRDGERCLEYRREEGGLSSGAALWRSVRCADSGRGPAA